MQHPLTNPSLAPFGFVFPHSKRRLATKIDKRFGGINGDKVIARLWDKMHRSNASRPLPVETIIHDILPGVATANRNFKTDFEFGGKPYLGRDIAILSSVVQWFGSGCGRCFLEDRTFGVQILHPAHEFTAKFEHEIARRDMVAFWAHECNPHCLKGESVMFFADPCYYDSKEISTRDRAVVDGLMRWLGTKAGRAFISEQSAWRKRANEAAQRRFRDSQRMPVAA